MYLLDTNICIYAINNKYPSVREKLFSLPASDIYIPSIVIYELEYGAEKSKWGNKTRKQMEAFIYPYENNILPFTREDAEICGKVRAELERQGLPIGLYDVMIASQGLARNFTVITHNVKEFSRVPSLKIQDWIGDEN